MSSVRGKRKLSAKQSKLEALKSLREFRELGLKRYEIADEDDSSDESIHDYLDENEYQERVSKLKESDFVVDDDGTGYVDNYEEEDDEELDEEEDEDDGGKKQKKKMKKSKKKTSGKLFRKTGDDVDQEEEGGKSHKLSSMFSKIAASAKRRNAVGPEGQKNSEEKAVELALKDESLDSMLQDLVRSSAKSEEKKRSKKKKSKESSTVKKLKKKLKKELKKAKKNSRMSFEETLEMLAGDSEDEERAVAKHKEKRRRLNSESRRQHDEESDSKSEASDSAPMFVDNGDDDADDTGFNAAMSSGEEDVGDVVTSSSQESRAQDPKPSEEGEDKPLSAMDMKAKLLARARSKPVRAAPKMPTTPVSGQKKADSSVTFMSTPPANFTDMDCGKDESGWTLKPQSMPQDEEAEGSSSQSSTGDTSKLPDIKTEDDGSTYLDFYYMDMYEDYFNSKGSVFLFGKVWSESAKQHVSCSIEVKNISRVLYVLPRENLRSQPDQPVSMQHVMDEIKRDVVDKVQPIAADGSRAFKCRVSKKKYAFELPGVPRESTEYLEVHYPMSVEKYRLDQDIQGETFSRIFGTNQSATEQVVLSRELKGPMWVRLKNVKFPDLSLSWCTYHGLVENARQITPLRKVLLEQAGDQTQNLALPPAPKLRVMSLSLKTVVNPDSHEHEIVMVSGLVRDHVNVVGSTENYNKNTEVRAFTIVRGGKGTVALPPGFRDIVKKVAPHVTVQNNERALLSYFLVQVMKLDPDVILGHNIRQFDLDVLYSRMKANQVSAWSKIGRLRLSKMPNKKADGAGFYSNINLTPGRLLLDTYVTAKELLLGQRSYTLTELCRTQLDRSRMEVQPSHVPFFYQTKEQLLKLVSVSEADAWLTLLLSFKLEAVPLTHQLTTLAGNLWSRTLAGGRAERIEFLLLHEFFRREYILPDKQTAKKNKGKTSNDNKQSKSRSATRKPKYDGGLVLEPKKGLYDKFILLLDFNSLYPSIIQEYNICYTTVERAPTEEDHVESAETRVALGEEGEGEQGVHEMELDDEDALPPLPDLAVHSELAVVPSLIRTLVERRKAVKNELKFERDDGKRAQLDVRQKALKLTANSMYGCLGFTGFRFFARPVAALVTSQGRSILQNTVDITQDKLGYEVVYGDTDSIMVNTNTTDLVVAKQIAGRIKQEINKLYKLLEIEQDGIFKTLLLLKKKKYAALAIKETVGPDGKPTFVTEKETKGLDLVRRDWCPLSKRVGHTVLDHILSGKTYDEIVDAIHEYLDTVQTEIKEGTVGLEEYVITKGLNKAPKDYPDAKSQPHLNVALAMVERGKPVNTGDHIPYVICTISRTEYNKRLQDLEKQPDNRKDQNDEEGELKPKELPSKSSASFAERAFHPEEVKSAPGGILKVDTEWYLKQQIVPPTQRLCEPIQGTSAAEIAHHLGLDPSQYHHGYEGPEEEDNLLNIANVSDAERFKACARLEITCSACQLEYNFPPGGIFLPEERNMVLERGSGEKHIVEKSASNQTQSAMVCPRCDAEVDVATLENKLVFYAREYVKRYYEGWLVADDPSVELRTRQQSVVGKSFVLNGRRLQLQREYGPGQLYTQLKYFESLVDVQRAEKEIEKLNQRRKEPLQLPKNLRVDQRNALAQIKDGFRTAFVEENAYNWVDPGLFKHAFRL